VCVCIQLSVSGRSTRRQKTRILSRARTLFAARKPYVAANRRDSSRMKNIGITTKCFPTTSITLTDRVRIRPRGVFRSSRARVLYGNHRTRRSVAASGANRAVFLIDVSCHCRLEDSNRFSQRFCVARISIHVRHLNMFLENFQPKSLGHILMIES